MAVDRSSSAVIAARSAVSDPLFWAKGRPEGECIVYAGSRDRQGYGKVMRIAVSSAPILAHRYAWSLLNGPIPAGLVVMHTCDNPPCIRPEHLICGTQAANIHDRDAKGHHRPGHLHGSQHPASKITDEDVLWIRRTARSGKWSTGDMARYLEVHPSTISNIVAGRNWKHLPLDGIKAA